MNILILSCNTGQGHNSAAGAIKESLERRGDSCELVNALQFLSQTADDIICDGHVFLYRRFPKLFGIGYRFEEKHSPKFICNQLRRGTEKFGKFFAQKNYDAIICTHIFGAILVNEFKKKTGAKILTSFVSTDYTVYPGVVEADADVYFIAHPLLCEEYVAQGIARDKLFASGIPVSAQFFKKNSKSDIRQALGLDKYKKIILISGGSMGAGPLAKLSLMLSQRFSDILIVVACGTNKSLLEKITGADMPNILAIPYTKKMSEYMDAADIYLTKAGGLSTTEAIMKQVPLIYVSAVPGCETRNIEFMTKHSYAMATYSLEETVEQVSYTFENIDSLSQNISRCRSELPQNPADAICEHISSCLGQK